MDRYVEANRRLWDEWTHVHESSAFYNLESFKQGKTKDRPFDALVLIEGHCDERGTNEYNLALGERRAKAAMNYLVAQGIDASRFTLISYGKERPVCSEKTEACWQLNRHDRFLTKPR